MMTTSTIQQKPPAYILQGWHREQVNSYDQYSSKQTFIIAPDGAIPFSRLRKCIQNIYDQRNQSLIPIHYDPWERKVQFKSSK